MERKSGSVEAGPGPRPGSLCVRVSVSGRAVPGSGRTASGRVRISTPSTRCVPRAQSGPLSSAPRALPLPSQRVPPAQQEPPAQVGKSPGSGERAPRRFPRNREALDLGSGDTQLLLLACCREPCPAPGELDAEPHPAARWWLNQYGRSCK